MPATKFDRDAMARWYAEEHLKTDPGITSVYYLPVNAGDREIRFIEVNELLGERNDEALDPIDFGIDIGSEGEHKLYVVDVSPEQWDRISKRELPLPDKWSLDSKVHFRG